MERVFGRKYPAKGMLLGDGHPLQCKSARMGYNGALGMMLSEVLNIGISVIASLFLACTPATAQRLKGSESKLGAAAYDTRMTVAEYAAKKGLSVETVENRFAATGVFSCPSGGKGTAQLTGANDVVTTSAHVFRSYAGNWVMTE